ncbi:MAG: hypothetical protein JWM82_1232 [Myxococcales bacterium]|nr:hypothetical protein [Myxococcales bacterium]
MKSKLGLGASLILLAVVGCGGSTSKPADAGIDGKAGGGSAGAKAGSDGGAGAGGGAAGASAGASGSDGGVASLTVGGTVAGLAGTGLFLNDGAGRQVAITANGTFMFPSTYAAGATVAVTVSQQPTAPAQVCTVTGGAIPSLTASTTSVMVTCTTPTFTVGGTVSGLTGTGLVLQNNAAGDLTVTADGAFTFATPVASGATFTVSVKTQPTAPAQTCQVTGGSGTVGGANVTSVTINCAVNSYTVGGTTSGLVGTGLVLQNDTAGDLSVTTNGVFAFAAPAHGGDAFAVTVKTQPSSPAQTCVVSQGAGTVAAGNVTTVSVDCTTNTYAVGGMVTGLTGAGLVLQNSLGDNLSVTAAGAFTFAKKVASGAAYAVTVLTQPSSPSQTCVVTAGSGTISTAAVTNVAVACAVNKLTIGGTVSGLTGTGLKLRNGGADDLTIAANGPFTFATTSASGATFAVTIATQPSTPDQTCTLSGATGAVGAANVTSVTVNCDTNKHTVGGTVAGLVGSGLALALNGGTPQAVGANGSFAFAETLPSGGTYAVTVASQPTAPSQTCVVAAGTGTITSADISNVAVTCTTNSFSVKGVVAGLVGTGLKLRNNAGDELAITANGIFTFATKIVSGQPYAVTVSAQPATPTQTCLVTAPSGTVATADVTNVTVQCTTNKYEVGGMVSGLAGTVVLKNGGDSISLTANGAFAFPTDVASGATYAVSVVTQPTTPVQICAVVMGSGTVTNAAVSDVSITCVTNQYKIGGSVTGLVGGGLVLQDNLGDDLPVAAAATGFTFATSVASGAPYAVTIKTQPSAPTQTCMVVGGTGTVGGADVGSVTVNCSTNSYVVGGTVVGLFGGGLVLQNNAGHDVAISGNGSFAFTPPLLSGDPYAVTVKTQPTNPSQTCVVTGGAGTIGGANISATVTCTSTPFSVSVAVTGVAGDGLVLQNNAGDSLVVAVDGTYKFATGVRSGLTYAVTVLTQPSDPWQTCTVTAPSGTIAAADVTLAVACVTNKYTIGGTVSGLSGMGLVLQDNGADDLAISSTGAFKFATPIASGAAYAVTVSASPTTPAQTCVVTDGTGSPNVLNISNVKVVCADTVNCAAVDEGQTAMLACPVGTTIGAIGFSSYGTPTGTCGAFALGTCNSTTSTSVVMTTCMGQQTCMVSANNNVFGDPCGGTFKKLWIQYACQ